MFQTSENIFWIILFTIVFNQKIDLQPFGHLLYRLNVAVFVSSNILEHQPNLRYVLH